MDKFKKYFFIALRVILIGPFIWPMLIPALWEEYQVKILKEDPRRNWTPAAAGGAIVSALMCVVVMAMIYIGILVWYFFYR